MKKAKVMIFHENFDGKVNFSLKRMLQHILIKAAYDWKKKVEYLAFLLFLLQGPKYEILDRLRGSFAIQGRMAIR